MWHSSLYLCGQRPDFFSLFFFFSFFFSFDEILKLLATRVKLSNCENSFDLQGHKVCNRVNLGLLNFLYHVLLTANAVATKTAGYASLDILEASEQ